MLILTRRVGETIVINGRQYEVTVLGVHGNHVRIGVTAPPDVEVHREEIYERIQKNKELGIEGKSPKNDGKGPANPVLGTRPVMSLKK